MKRPLSKQVLSSLQLVHLQLQFYYDMLRIHIDYCFVSKDLADKIQGMEIGNHEFWTKYSDHVPVIVSFKDV